MFFEGLEDGFLEAGAVDLIFRAIDPVSLLCDGLAPAAVQKPQHVSGALLAELMRLDLIVAASSLQRPQDLRRPEDLLLHSDPLPNVKSGQLVVLDLTISLQAHESLDQIFGVRQANNVIDGMRQSIFVDDTVLHHLNLVIAEQVSNVVHIFGGRSRLELR